MMREEYYPQDTVRTVVEVNGNSPAVIKMAKMCQEYFSSYMMTFTFSSTHFSLQSNLKKKGDIRKWLEKNLRIKKQLDTWQEAINSPRRQLAGLNNEAAIPLNHSTRKVLKMKLTS